MKARIKYAIIGVHERDEMIADMLKSMQKDFSIVYYDETRSKNCLGRLLKVLNKYTENNEYTHICVLQDDLELCDHFTEIVETICGKYPDCIINPYNSKLTWDDKKLNTPYVLISGHGIYGQCIIIPTKYVSDFTKWATEYCPENYPHDDVALGTYAKRKKVPVMSTIPCLMQHLAPTLSTLKYNNAKKVSKVYMGKTIPQYENWGSSNYSVSHYITNSSGMAKRIKGEIENE